MSKDISRFPQRDESTLRSLESVAVRRKFPKNTILFSKGDESDSLYVVRTGTVKVVLNDEKGRELVLAVLGPGEYFGEMAAADEAPRSATVITREPTEVLMIRRSDFRSILKRNPDLADNLLKVLLNRLRQTDEQIDHLAFMNAQGRVLDFLMQLAEPEGERWVVRGKLSHQEIGHSVGCSREMVSKAFRKLVKQKTISMEADRIVIYRKSS